MPLFVTDTDVLGQIALNNSEADSIARQVAAITSSASSLTGWADSLAAWTSDLTDYRTWAGAATGRLSGGFILGEWDPVADGNDAIAWKTKLDAWQATFNLYATGKAPASPVPTGLTAAQVSAANNQAIVNTSVGAVQGVLGPQGVGGAVGALAVPMTALAVIAVVGAFFFVELRK